MPNFIRKLKNILKRLENIFINKRAYRFIIRDWSPLFNDMTKAADVLSTMRVSQQLEPFEVDRPKGKKFLVIAPHPDDEIIGPGGTLLKMAQNGAEISILFLTSGKKGEEEIRRKESNSVAKEINATVEFLNFNANNIPDDDFILDKISSAVSKHGKDGIFVTFLLDDHPDHRIASELLYKAYLKNKILPNTPIWAYQVYTSILPNVIVDITNVVKNKKKLISFYQSQYRYRNWEHYTLGLNAYNGRFLKNRNDESFAEIFFQVPMKDYAELCKKCFGNNN